MEHYFLYIAIASATIVSPGPGVVLTITNALRYGFLGAMPGVLGVAVGVLCVATISSAGLAIILATSAMAFTLLKYIGAAYLMYLGLKMWRSSLRVEVEQKNKNHKLRFTEGLLITLLNPKAIFFFMALFPQFIDQSKSYTPQFVLLAVTFSILLVLIHCAYAAFANAAKLHLSTPVGKKIVSRVGGSFYMLFGIGLAASSK